MPSGALTAVHLGAALSTLPENCRCCKFSTELCGASSGIWYQGTKQGFFPPVGRLCVITVTLFSDTALMARYEYRCRTVLRKLLGARAFGRTDILSFTRLGGSGSRAGNAERAAARSK